MTNWLELAQRCEQATGPDREIDAAIMFDAFAKPVGFMSDGGPRGYLWPDDNPSWSFGIRFPGKDRDWFYRNRAKDEKETLLLERDGALVLMNDLRVPRLTASLDAITALIERELPEALYCVRLLWDAEGKAALGAVSVYVGEHTERYVGPQHTGIAPTAALALCAAFCRAMHTKDKP